MKKIEMSDRQKEEWRQLARDGYGDDVIYDQSDNIWVVFRDPIGNSPNTVCVKSESHDYTDVKTINFANQTI